MRFDFTPEQESFRSELRAFLDSELPAGWTGPADEANDEHWALSQRIRQKLAQRGWLTMSWPREHGGIGAPPTLSLIFAEEMAYRRAPGNDRFGTRMIGPTLIAFGSEEQKTAHLPGIARGEVQWCQGYSEPDAGSDLASMSTRADADGGFYVINGTKVWTSLAHRADWMFMLARTDAKAQRHRGISMFLVDMKSPGVTVRPLINMAGSHSFNQVIFDNVRVPVENRVGAENDGWRVGTALLNFERANIDYIAWAQRTLDELKAFARSAPVHGSVGARRAVHTVVPSRSTGEGEPARRKPVEGAGPRHSERAAATRNLGQGSSLAATSKGVAQTPLPPGEGEGEGHRDAATLSHDPDIRRRLAEFEAEIEQARLVTYEAVWRQGRGESPIAESSMSKLLGSDVNLRLHEYGVEMLGMYGQLELNPTSPLPLREKSESNQQTPLPAGEGWGEGELLDLAARIFKLRMFYTSGPILAGTNEIQKNIIAQRGLGLPRE